MKQIMSKPEFIEKLADAHQYLDQLYLEDKISSDEYWRRLGIYEDKISFQDQLEVTKLIINRIKLSAEVN